MSAQIGAVTNPLRPRAAALVGPPGGGKTILFERLMAAAGAPVAPADPQDGVVVGRCRFKNEPWSLVDCPGAVDVTPEIGRASCRERV